jgi:Tfp pilus assembly PilM family ATPase
MWFQRAQPVIGLDIGSSAIKLLQLTSSKKGYALEKFGIKTIDPELIVDGAVMDAGRVVDAVKELLREQAVKTKDVVISVSGHSVIVKKINLPPMTEDELEESIKWEAEQYIPFDVNDVNLDFHILPNPDAGGEGKDTMAVVLVAVKKDRLSVPHRDGSDRWSWWMSTHSYGKRLRDRVRAVGSGVGAGIEASVMSIHIVRRLFLHARHLHRRQQAPR